MVVRLPQIDAIDLFHVKVDFDPLTNVLVQLNDAIESIHLSGEETQKTCQQMLNARMSEVVTKSNFDSLATKVVERKIRESLERDFREFREEMKNVTSALRVDVKALQSGLKQVTDDLRKHESNCGPKLERTVEEVVHLHERVGACSRLADMACGYIGIHRAAVVEDGEQAGRADAQARLHSIVPEEFWRRNITEDESTPDYAGTEQDVCAADNATEDTPDEATVNLKDLQKNLNSGGGAATPKSEEEDVFDTDPSGAEAGDVANNSADAAAEGGALEPYQVTPRLSADGSKRIFVPATELPTKSLLERASDSERQIRETKEAGELTRSQLEKVSMRRMDKRRSTATSSLGRVQSFDNASDSGSDANPGDTIHGRSPLMQAMSLPPGLAQAQGGQGATVVSPGVLNEIESRISTVEENMQAMLSDATGALVRDVLEDVETTYIKDIREKLEAAQEGMTASSGRLDDMHELIKDLMEKQEMLESMGGGNALLDMVSDNDSKSMWEEEDDKFDTYSMAGSTVIMSSAAGTQAHSTLSPALTSHHQGQSSPAGPRPRSATGNSGAMGSPAPRGQQSGPGSVAGRGPRSRMGSIVSISNALGGDDALRALVVQNSQKLNLLQTKADKSDIKSIRAEIREISKKLEQEVKARNAHIKSSLEKKADMRELHNMTQRVNKVEEQQRKGHLHVNEVVKKKVDREELDALLARKANLTLVEHTADVSFVNKSCKVLQETLEEELAEIRRLCKLRVTRKELDNEVEHLQESITQAVAIDGSGMSKCLACDRRLFANDPIPEKQKPSWPAHDDRPVTSPHTRGGRRLPKIVYRGGFPTSSLRKAIGLSEGKVYMIGDTQSFIHEISPSPSAESVDAYGGSASHNLQQKGHQSHAPRSGGHRSTSPPSVHAGSGLRRRTPSPVHDNSPNPDEDFLVAGSRSLPVIDSTEDGNASHSVAPSSSDPSIPSGRPRSQEKRAPVEERPKSNDRGTRGGRPIRYVQDSNRRDPSPPLSPSAGWEVEYTDGEDGVFAVGKVPGGKQKKKRNRNDAGDRAKPGLDAPEPPPTILQSVPSSIAE
eukprot:Rmarinus@m.21743